MQTMETEGFLSIKNLRELKIDDNPSGLLIQLGVITV